MSHEWSNHDWSIQFKPSLPGAPLALDSERSEYREAISQLLDFARRRDMFICGHHDRLMAYDATLLAMGFYEVLGCATAGELARRYRVIRWLGQAACREKT
ncbi:MAG TPA: hypothetical protein VFC44_24870 [Candidatus Saccharimonadales bacterium]|nr:hypothetical protein [Candidatus Saccharimonadales bacterium]